MRLDPNLPVIPLRVVLGGPSGEIEVEMALDTGATYAMVPWDISQKLGYDPAVSRERAKLVTASTTEIAPLITLDYMEVLGVRIPGIQVACHDLPPTSKVQGLLGLSYLKNCNLSLRYKDSQLELEDCWNLTAGPMKEEGLT